MPSFNNLKQLEAYLKKQIRHSLNQEVRIAVDKVYTDIIQEVVYDAYKEPSQYERRFSLKRPENIEHNIIDNGNSIILTVRNIAKWNTANDGEQVNLPALIEYGDGYNGDFYKYPQFGIKSNYEYTKPRPFTKTTEEEIFKQNIHINALRKALKSRGISI